MWSFRLGRVLGIEVRIHFLFIVLLALVGLSALLRGGFLACLLSLIFISLVFAFVFLHELGHSLVARRYGIHVRDITLWPLGGIASMDRIPQEPQVEMVIALAGPAVNLALAILLTPLAVVTYLLNESLFTVYLLEVNLVLLFFNLLPAFPMDGGRVYRAWQAKRVGYQQATRKAVQLGQIIAIIMGCLGLVTLNFLLLAIAAFVFVAGREELAMIESQYQQIRNFYFFHLDPQQQGRPGTNYHRPGVNYQGWVHQLQIAMSQAGAWALEFWHTMRRWSRRFYKKAKKWWQEHKNRQ
jgi:stage IV sporulation protein FB